ncbi:MAG: TatD family hydrolase [Candidatus Bathyarchaeia archaeon]
MKFVDAHVHLSDDEYASCVDEIIADAQKSQVVALVSNSVDLKTCVDNLRLAEKYPETVYVALGVHPWNVQTITEGEVQQIVELIEERRQNEALVAVGEIGLDSKYDKIMEKQQSVFAEMLHTAERFDLPVIVHSRGMTGQIVDMLPSYRLKRVLLHCFSSPISALSKAVEKGYYITEGAPTLYSNGIREVVKKVPLTNLLTETDGPVRFFRPPFDGKRTTPAFIPTVVKAIAEIKELAVEDVAEQIIENFEEFFKVNFS